MRLHRNGATLLFKWLFYWYNYTSIIIALQQLHNISAVGHTTFSSAPKSGGAIAGGVVAAILLLITAIISVILLLTLYIKRVKRERARYAIAR